MSRLTLLKGFLAIYLPLCGLLAVVGLMHYYTNFATERASRESSEMLNVGLARRMISADISAVVSDLRFLAEHVERQRLFDLPPSDRRRHIALEFEVFAEKKRLYDQIRFLNREGMEIVRVNYIGRQPKLVPEYKLQNKSNRYYFQEALGLEKDKIYISPLDLNVEEGRIEYPLKPMMRFATPIFDTQNQKRGVILLNYFGDRLIQDFVLAAANIADHIELINSEGFWLRSPNPDDEWGFMLGNNKTLPGRYPGVWQRMTAAESGQFETEHGLFTFHTLSPARIALSAADSDSGTGDNRVVDTDYWKILSHVSSAELSATLPLFLRSHLVLYISMFLLISLGSWLLAHSQFRHRRAEAQSEYERRFRYTLENIELAAVALDRQGTVRFCNDYFLKLTGWNSNEVIGKQWLDQFAPPEINEDVSAVIESMDMPVTFPTRFETQVRARDGGLRLITWNNTLSYDADGKVIGVTGIGEDVTEQRHAEEELRKLYRAVEQSPSIVLITNQQGLIEYVNPKFTEVTGYEPEEVIGYNPKVLKSGTTSPEEYSDLWTKITNGEEWRGEFHNRKKNGELYWESASISALRNADGKITNFLAVKEDITEQKRLEKVVESRNRELAKTQALAAMGRMASMIAHDLRNPLSSIKMTLQILGKHSGEVSQQKHELLDISLSQIRYMEEILSDMLTYSRPDALKTEWLAIDKVIDSAIGLAQRKIDESAVKLITDFQPGLPTILGDANKLRQVFSNLITNAVQATDTVDDPLVTVEALVNLGPAGTGIQISICDNGCGVDPADQEKLFEPFFTTRAKGTGLGLAIVKRILEQHQAKVSLHANGPRGTCAAVIIPRTPQTIEDIDLEASEWATS